MQDFREILTSIGYILIDNGKEYRGCPLYRDSDNDTSLKIDKQTGRFIDFSANISGSFEELIKLSLNFSNLNDVKTWLSNKHGYNPLISKYNKPRLKTIKRFSKSCLNEIINNHDYWITRGISKEILIEFNGGTMFSGKMYNRYVFPIFNSEKQIIGISGRDLSNSNKRPKWKHIGEKSYWKYPLFINYNDIKNHEPVILVESIGDCLSLFECGIRNVIVIFGISLNQELLSLLLKLDPKKIIISLNNDSDNQNVGNIAGEKINEKLSNYFDKQQIITSFPPFKDWNDCLLKDKKIITNWYKNI